MQRSLAGEEFRAQTLRSWEPMSLVDPVHAFKCTGMSIYSHTHLSQYSVETQKTALSRLQAGVDFVRILVGEMVIWNGGTTSWGTE